MLIHDNIIDSRFKNINVVTITSWIPFIHPTYLYLWMHVLSQQINMYITNVLYTEFNDIITSSYNSSNTFSCYYSNNHRKVVIKVSFYMMIIVLNNIILVVTMTVL